jgi:hypothetical protein
MAAGYQEAPPGEAGGAAMTPMSALCLPPLSSLRPSSLATGRASAPSRNRDGSGPGFAIPGSAFRKPVNLDGSFGPHPLFRRPLRLAYMLAWNTKTFKIVMDDDDSSEVLVRLSHLDLAGQVYMAAVL